MPPVRLAAGEVCPCPVAVLAVLVAGLADELAAVRFAVGLADELAAVRFAAGLADGFAERLAAPPDATSQATSPSTATATTRVVRRRRRTLTSRVARPPARCAGREPRRADGGERRERAGSAERNG
ncbi:MAG: hypothetical protein ACYCSX_07520 [Acidimicrobiales bacterium]